MRLDDVAQIFLRPRNASRSSRPAHRSPQWDGLASKPRENRPRFRPSDTSRPLLPFLESWGPPHCCLSGPILFTPTRPPRPHSMQTGRTALGSRSHRGRSLQFLRQRRAPSRFPRWLHDLDRSALAGGSMIRHAATAAFPVGPLAVAVIGAVPPGFAGSAGWQAASVPVSSGAGTHPRSRPAPGSRNCRCKTSPRNPNHGKTTAVTPLLWPSHPARVWTTALFRGTLAMPWWCPLTGAAIKKPRSLARSGFPLSTFGPALPEPRQTAGSGACLHRVDLLHVNTLSALSRESAMVAGTGGIEGYGWESGRLQIAAAPGATKRGAGRNRISRGPGKKQPRSRPSRRLKMWHTFWFSRLSSAATPLLTRAWTNRRACQRFIRRWEAELCPGEEAAAMQTGPRQSIRLFAPSSPTAPVPSRVPGDGESCGDLDLLAQSGIRCRLYPTGVPVVQCHQLDPAIEMHTDLVQLVPIVPVCKSIHIIIDRLSQRITVIAYPPVEQVSEWMP